MAARTGKQTKTNHKGALHAKYRTVEPNQLRIVVRPYLKPPTFYTVSSGGVFVHKGERWNKTLKARLLRAGYSVRVIGNSTVVFEKTVARRDSE